MSLKPGTSIIQFDVSSTAADGPAFSGTVGSDAMRWFLFWSDESQLWVYGDEGVYVWGATVEGSYEKNALRPDSTALIKKMPVPVFEALPSVLKDRWASTRGEGSG